MNDSVLLREATVQEIQLELIRRTKFNAFDGERIHAGLMKHRAYWQAVLLDRPGLANYQKPRHLLMSGLINWRASSRRRTGAARNRSSTTTRRRSTPPSALAARNTDFYRSGGIEWDRPEEDRSCTVSLVHRKWQWTAAATDKVSEGNGVRFIVDGSSMAFGIVQVIYVDFEKRLISG
jgi:hypothetical protein